MSPENDREIQPRLRRSRWKTWTIVGLNVVGILLAIPLLKVALPLVGIWWHTRSQSSLRSVLPKQESSSVPTSAESNPVGSEEPNITNASANALASLTNKLAVVDTLSEKEIQQIVAQHFGSVANPGATNGDFDLASAVFDSISRTNVNYGGKTYFGYQVNLVDQNGRHRTNLDCFAEPNLEYERSLQTLDLINGSPQLKKIYRAMAGSLAAKSANQTNSDSTLDSDEPILRLQPGTRSPER